MQSKAEIFTQLKSVLHEAFEISPEEICESAHLYHDLDLDSIDAIDLVVKIQDITGAKISPQDFKSVETVSDVIDHIAQLISPQPLNA